MRLAAAMAQWPLEVMEAVYSHPHGLMPDLHSRAKP
jgi:hypothetical protein